MARRESLTPELDAIDRGIAIREWFRRMFPFLVVGLLLTAGAVGFLIATR